MAAKLLHSLTDDNPDLQKQIGCMTGIFQMFDRQQMLTGGRRIVGQTPKRISAGNSNFSSNTQPRSSSLEKHSHKNMQDRQQRVSTESSRASFTSSSRSSSFSSLDCSRPTHLEPATFDRMIFPETPSRDPSMGPHNSSSFQSSRQNADLRDFVKDSIYREVYNLSSARAKTIEDDDDDQKKKQYTPADIKESLRILAKFQEEEPKHHHEPIRLSRSSSYHSKDGSSFSISKDAPRFSYDGKEINRTRFDSRDGPNSTLRLKDLPRLSLDSREGSMRSLTADSKSNSFLKSMKNGIVDGSNTIQSNNRPPSVVAKLMGLEALPQSVSSSDTNVGSSRNYFEDEDLFNNFGKTSQIKSTQQSSYSNGGWKEQPISPRWRNADMKPMPRFPNEPAPWKQIDDSRASQKAASRSTRGSAKSPSSFPSVYSEIEKRLKDLEFTQSGKDLRALKQILEAMQAKGLLETPEEGEDSNFINHNERQQKPLGSNRKLENERNLDFLKRRNVASQKYESPIVIMKPAKLVGKSGIPAAASVIPLDGLTNLPKVRGGDDNRKGMISGRSSKDSNVRANRRDNNNALSSVNMKSDRTLKTVETLTRSKSSGSSISPRMQQKKMELEKRSRPPTPPDLSRSRRQSNVKQQAESNSPGGRRRVKQVSSHQSDDQMSEVSVESRNLSSHENEDSAQSNEISDMVNSSERSPSLKSTEFMLSGLEEKKPNFVLSGEESAESPAEYSSPVSVLDNAVYKHDSPSPVKYVGKNLKVDASMGSERELNPVQDNLISNSTESFSTFDINRKKLQNIENLVQKLRRLNSSHDEARTDYIASLCENSNPDHRYISEILLASGLLLRDLSSTLSDFQFHSSGNPINPELFLVLEQTKASSTASSKEGYCGDHKTNLTTQKSEKFHRKLLFDAVNEILAGKLAFAGPHLEPWLRPRRIAVKGLNAQKLLRELCSEIESLQSKNSKRGSVEEEKEDDDDGWKKILYEDVMHGSERWIDFDGEISGAILDIERSIFKDLVDEIVLGESAARSIKKVGRRKLFAK